MSPRIIYVCPTDKTTKCSWEGDSEDILEHFIMEHEDLLDYSSEVNIGLATSSENRLLFLNEEIYLIMLTIEDSILKIGLRFLGPKRIANTISYDIVLKVNGQSYFSNFFNDDNKSIIQVNEGYWIVNLNPLRSENENLNEIQCNFNISNKNEVLENPIEDEEEDFSNTTICDVPSEENNEFLDSPQEQEQEQEDKDFLRKKTGDALDNISFLNFNILENTNKHIRRFSSLIGIPEGLFEEKRTTNLSCSNCFIDMLPPIYFCVNDHNVCADCKFESCKICYGRVTENRNKDLEEYSRKRLHLCRYHSEGCPESFMYNEIRAHEMKCNFCTYNCLEDCSFKGKFLELRSHFKINHSSFKLFYSTPVSFPGNSDFVVYDSILGIFHCKSILSSNMIRWIVIFLGPKDRNFSCELMFKGSRSTKGLFLKRLENQYSIAQSRESLKKLRVKDKNALLNITSYFQ